MGWLIGIPVLTGAIFRLAAGNRDGQVGRPNRLWSAAHLCGDPDVSRELLQFLLGVLRRRGWDLASAEQVSPLGIAYTSVWFPKHQQGTALGIFGAGNAGAALTSLGAPHVLNWLTDRGQNLEGWRQLPKMYAAMLVITGVVFSACTRRIGLPPGSATKTLRQRLLPLKDVRVWRFGLYYFFVFGGFVALAQWLVPYYVNAYATSVALAGALAACNSLPSGVIRAFGGWLSDKFGARTVMYWVLGCFARLLSAC